MTTALDMAADRLAAYRQDYRKFVREEFGVTPDPWQDDALARMSVGLPQKVRESYQSCAGSGKSALMSWAALASMALNGGPGNHPQGVAISMSRDNLRAGLQKEIARWLKQSEFLSETFELTTDRLYARGFKDTWFLDFRGWSKKATPEEQGDTLSGLHAQAMNAYFIDEAGAILPIVGRRAEQGMGDPMGRGLILMAGNPFNRDSLLGDACEDPDYHTTEVTADPDDPNRTSRVALEEARKWVDKYGRDDPWVICYVLGRFPPGGLNQLLGREDVAEAMRRNPRRELWEGDAKVLGVDVAEMGLDRSVIFPRQGLVAFPPITMRGYNDVQGAAAVARKWVDWQADGCFVDATGGFGTGWISRLRDRNFKPVPVKFSENKTIPPAEQGAFVNMRAYMAWQCREWVLNGGALPQDAGLTEELVTPTYTFRGDKMLLEDKDKIRARLGRSPDLADALWLTFADVVLPKSSPVKDAFDRVRRGPQRTRMAGRRGRGSDDD